MQEPETPIRQTAVLSRNRLTAWGAMLLASLGLGLIAVRGGWLPFALGSGSLIIALLLYSYGATLWILLIALLPFSVEIGIPGTASDIVLLTELLIPVLTAVAIVGILMRGKFCWIRSPLNGAVLFFVLVMLLTLLASREPWVSIKAIVRDTSCILAGFFLVRYFLDSKGKIRALLYGCTLTCILITFYGLYTQMIQGVAIYQPIGYPFFTDHCIYAAFLTFHVSILTAFILAYPESRWRNLGLVILGLWGFAIAMTFVRGAWISLFALAGYYLYIFRRSVDLKLLLAAAMAVVIGVGVVSWLQLSHLFAERLTHLTDMSYVTNYDRVDRWMAAWHIFLEHPILGVGWGRYADEYFRYIYYLDTYSTEIRMGAHNLYLEILSESGILGGIAYSILIGVFALEARRLRRRCQDRFYHTLLIGIPGAMITYLVHAIVNNLGPSDKIAIYFWLFIGLIPLISHFMEKQRGRTERECVS